MTGPDLLLELILCLKSSKLLITQEVGWVEENWLYRQFVVYGSQSIEHLHNLISLDLKEEEEVTIKHNLSCGPRNNLPSPL